MSAIATDKDGNLYFKGLVFDFVKLQALDALTVEQIEAIGEGGGGGGTYEEPTGTVNGINAAFTFTAPPILVFRNGVMEKRLGSVVGNVFTFVTPPETGDDIEGLV